jgi:hypothetical protein
MRPHSQRGMVVRFYLDAFKDARGLTTWQIIKIEKTKFEFLDVREREWEREFLDVRERESEREFLDVRVLREVRCEVLEFENENDEKKMFMMLIKLFKYWMNLFVWI